LTLDIKFCWSNGILILALHIIVFVQFYSWTSCQKKRVRMCELQWKHGKPGFIYQD
jgi:hypothetical protein